MPRRRGGSVGGVGRFDPAGAAGRLFRAARDTDWTGRAKSVADTLKREYEAGKRGDDGPVTPLWAGPREQYTSFVALLRGPVAASTDTDTDDAVTPEEEAAMMSSLLDRVDWTAVRESAADRSTEAVDTMRTMAAQVDWERLAPVATTMSSALIAAVAAGRLPVGGKTGAMVARAIVDHRGVARQLGEKHLPPGVKLDDLVAVVRPLAADPPLRQPITGVVDTTAREVGGDGQGI
jgi:hypothetical protein